MPDIEMEKEDIATSYAAILDSVALVSALKSKKNLDDEENDVLSRNINHLHLMLGRNVWADYDMKPVTLAITMRRKNTVPKTQ